MNPPPTGNKGTIKILYSDKIVTDYFTDCLVREFILYWLTKLTGRLVEQQTNLIGKLENW